MKKIKIPVRKDVSINNQAIFDYFQNKIGFVPNIHATLAFSRTALENYMQFSEGKTSLTYREKESISLVVSQVNNSKYCLSAHSHFGKKNGFTKREIIEIRNGGASFDSQLDALIKFTKEVTITKGKISETSLEHLLDAGYSMETVIDIVLSISDKIITNYVHNITQVAVDFPLASNLKSDIATYAE